jgi:hypothetical protein
LTNLQPNLFPCPEVNFIFHLQNTHHNLISISFYFEKLFNVVNIRYNLLSLGCLWSLIPPFKPLKTATVGGINNFAHKERFNSVLFLCEVGV